MLKAYALSSDYEYFAELSEAFFTSSRFYNDYFPFIHSELYDFDKNGYDLISQVWGVNSQKYMKTFEHPNQILLSSKTSEERLTNKYIVK